MMRKLLLTAGVWLSALLPMVAQTPTDQAYRELVSRLQKSKPDTNRVQLLQELFTYYLAQTNQTALDTALSIAGQAEKLSLALHYPKGQANSCLLLSRIYNRQGSPEKGKEFLNKAIRLFSANRYLDELGEAYFELGSYFALSGPEMTERIRLSELALATFKQSGNKLKQANCNRELGDLYQIEGNYFKSLTTLKESLKLYQSIGNPKPQLEAVYDLLGAVSSVTGDYPEAVRYGLLAVDVAEQLQDTTTQLATIYNRLGITYYRLNEFEQANTYFYKSIAIAKRHQDGNTVGVLAANISNNLIRLSRPLEALAFMKGILKNFSVTDSNYSVIITCNFVEIYLRLKQYALAKQYCERLLAFSEKPKSIDHGTLSMAYSTLVNFYLATRQFNLAQQYMMAHKALAEKERMAYDLLKISLYWFRLDSTQGHYQSAILHYQQYKALNDSLLNESKSKRISQLQIQYETEKKDQDIKLKGQSIALLTKQGQLQQSQLKQANLIKNVTFGGVALLLIIVGLLYNRYQLKQRNNRKLEAQQKEINDQNLSLQQLVKEKEWLLKEIHHRVKNNLQIVMSLLNSQSVYLENEAAMMAIRDSQHRVQAISLIHQKLYQSENLSAIDMPAYIRELVEYLRDIFDTGQRIRFNTQIEPVKLDVSYAVPVGLILNEAITNGIKYAFPKNREGLITITLNHTHEAHYLLTIADDGVGLPANFDSQQSSSLGMSLMRGLSEDMDGLFSIKSQPGTAILIEFDYEPVIRHDSVLLTSDIPMQKAAL